MARDQSPVDKLLDIAYELGETARRLSLHIEFKEYHLMPLDVSAITAATSQILAVTPAIAAIGTSDAATQEATDQAAVDAASGPLASAVAALVAAAPASPTPTPTPTPTPVNITITPTTVTTPVGTPLNGQLDASGGTAPYSFAIDPSAPPPPSDVTLSSTGALSVGGLVAETGTINVIATDASGNKSASTQIGITVS